MKISRREFVHAGCGVAAVTLAPSIVDKAFAWTHGVVSAFNGGRSQIQNFDLDFLDTSYPFLNCVKSGSRWGYIGGPGGVATTNRVDADGYPTSFPASVTSAVTNIPIPNQAARSGNYVITWDGASTIGFNGQTMTTVSGSVTASGGHGRYVFTPNSAYTQVNLSVLVSGFTNITNLKMFFLGPGATTGGDEDLYNSGEIFGTQFISVMRQLKCGVIRFGDWAKMNDGNATTWSTRRAQSYFIWGSYELRPSLYAGTTTSTGDAFKISFGSGAPTDKLQIILSFDHSTNTAGLTLELNNTGVAYPILDPVGSAIPALSGVSPVIGNNSCLVFDSVLGGWLLTTNNGGLFNGVPPEVYFALAVKLGAHPHFVTPYLACDPMTDYMTSLAAYCRANSPSWMVPRFEGPNETWNNGGGFYATRYAWNKSNAYWHLTPEQDNWYGLVMRNIGSAISAIYSADTSKYSILCGVQLTVTPSGVNPRLDSQRQLSSRACSINSGNGSTCQITDVGNNYPANTPIQIISTGSTSNVPSPLTKNAVVYYVKTPGDTFTISLTPGGAAIVYTFSQTWAGSQYTVICDLTAPYSYVTHVCPSTYITPSEYRSNIEVQRAFAYQGGDLTQIDNYVDSLAADVTDGTNTGNLPANRALYIAWKAWGAGFGVNKMTAYEGGYSFNPLTVSGSFGVPPGTPLPVTSPVTGATQTNPCVVTLATTVVQSSATRPGNPAVAGMTISFASVGGMTQLNGLTGTVTAVAGNNVTVNIDASGFSAYTSGGTATYVNAGTWLYNFRLASKASTHLQGYTYGTPAVGTKSNYQNFAEAGGEFPSQYFFAGTTDSAWSLYAPNVYAAPSPAALGIATFNQ